MCLLTCLRACNVGARPRKGTDFKEKSGSDATEYIIDLFLSCLYAVLKSRSGLRVNLSVPETDSVQKHVFYAHTFTSSVCALLPVDLSTVGLLLLSFSSFFLHEVYPEG